MATDVTRLIRRWSDGDPAAYSELTTALYVELRRMARHFLANERAGHSMRSSDLVHDAYLRMVDQRHAHFEDRKHFFSVAAQIMRRILVDHARAKQRIKRGGDAVTLALADGVDMPAHRDYEMLALNDALNGLAKLDALQSRIVELRFFGGLSIIETADVLGISKTTVNRHWVTARAWLTRELSRS